jgi:hypothetical protein
LPASSNCLRSSCEFVDVADISRKAEFVCVAMTRAKVVYTNLLRQLW